LGSIGGILVRKLVKPTNVVCSWASYQRRFSKILPPQTQPNIRTASAGVLGKADAAVRQKLGRFDPANRILDQMAEFFTLSVADSGPEILNLDESFADEHDLSNVCDTGNPGVANQLRIESE
jgi:hypothetical protein